MPAPAACCRRLAFVLGLCLLACAGPAEAARTLFGATGFAGTPLPQWRAAVAKLDDALTAFDACAAAPSGCAQPRLAALIGRLEGLRGLPRLAQIEAVNRLANARPYRSDIEAYGRRDHWAGPLEFLANSGDCEDYALFKYAALAWLGVPDRDLRVVLVRALPADTAHAVLAVETGAGRQILDDAAPQVRAEASIGYYRPVAAFNRSGRWGYLTRAAALPTRP